MVVRARLARPSFAWPAVVPACVVLTLVLLLSSAGYGYERDELYFRMLPPAWGYVDQPPLTPLLVHAIAGVLDTPTAIRMPAIVLAVASVTVLALVAREVGGGLGAQALAAWGTAAGAFTLIAGHVFLTATWDLVVWPLVLLAVFRARLRGDPRWWLLAGSVAGASMENKLLIALLLVGVVVGLVVVGPRAGLVNRWTAGAVGLVLLLGAPSLIYQALHGLPQLAVGAALEAHKAGTVRPEVVPLLLLWIGPLLVPVWIAGFVRLVWSSTWRAIRFYWLTFTIVIALVILLGTQPYYPYGVLTTLFAIGCMPTARWARTRGRRLTLGGAVVITASVNALLALPVIPVTLIGHTPLPSINQTDADSIGWPTYAAEIAHAWRQAGPDAIVLTGNYGEAGAMDRYAPRVPTYSGQNALHDLPAPPSTTRTIIAVDGDWLAGTYATCRTVAHLDDHLGVQNEEQDVPISICTKFTVPISTIWAATAHLD